MHISVIQPNVHLSEKRKVGYEQDSVKIMIEPCAVAVDQRGLLYVCDRASSDIYRFQLSNSLDEDITPED